VYLQAQVLLQTKHHHICVMFFSPSMLENYEENFTVELEHPSNFSGRIRYTFVSFWSRNRTFRALEAALQGYKATLEADVYTCSPINR